MAVHSTTVAQITESQRVRRIKQLVEDLHRVPPEKHETIQMPLPGGNTLLDVVRIGVDEVLLNPNSHRIRSQLQDDQEWVELGKDPFSEAAQKVVERHVRGARTPDEFAALKESLVEEGQTHPGVITHTGLLINANTRAVALRDVADPNKRYIRVAVLPSTVRPDELALLELRLQMQKELKVDYTMTNALLFIEELSVQRGMPARQIAHELRISPESPRKGENEVTTRLKLLDLVRTLQRLADPPLPLRFFDERIRLEQLREVHRVWAPLVEHEPARARQHLVSFLLSISVGVKAVHEIRRVDADFMGEYMLPHLERDPALGQFADALVAPAEDAADSNRPHGIDALAGKDRTGEQDTIAVDVGRLVHLVTRRDKRIELQGTNVVVDQDDLKDALRAAVSAGVEEKRRDVRDEDQLSAPTSAVREAIKQIGRAKEALITVHAQPEFDAERRKKLEAAYKKLARACRDLESTLKKTNVIPK